jgi:hypothetical protein
MPVVDDYGLARGPDTVTLSGTLVALQASQPAVHWSSQPLDCRT